MSSGIKRWFVACLVGGLGLSVVAQEQPNILFLLTDDQTYDSINALGNKDIRTPNMDRLANRGVSFSACYNMGGWHGAICVASRTMLNTGRSLWRARDIEEHLGEPANVEQMWPVLMRKAGYRTMITGKWHVKGPKPSQLFDVARHIRPGMPSSVESAYERPVEGEPDMWQPWDKRNGGYWQGGRHWTAVAVDDVISYLEGSVTNKEPFFIYAAFNAPHDPRQSPEEFVKKYPPEKILLPPNVAPTNPHKDDIGCEHSLRDERLAPDPRTEYALRVHRSEYYALISHLDSELGRLFDVLERTGRDKDTIVFFTSDHGLSLGQHGFMGKQNMFEHSLRAPLLVAGPGIPVGKRIETPVYVQDIVPTVLGLAGAEVPKHIDFKTLLPLLKGESEKHHECVYAAYMQLQRMVRVGDMKLIWYPKVEVYLLFDLANDPFELKNLAADAEYAEVLVKLKSTLVSEMARVGDPLQRGR